MNPQITAAIRNALIIAGTAASTKFGIDGATTTAIISAAMTVVPVLWSLWGHRKDGIIASAAALPEVQKIVTTQEIANSPAFVADPTVVGPDLRGADGRYR